MKSGNLPKVNEKSFLQIVQDIVFVNNPFNINEDIKIGYQITNEKLNNEDVTSKKLLKLKNKHGKYLKENDNNAVSFGVKNGQKEFEIALSDEKEMTCYNIKIEDIKNGSDEAFNGNSNQII